MNVFTAQRKVAFYIRVSTERQAKVEEGSLKNQEQMLRAEWPANPSTGLGRSEST
jgi:hypothetical protein